MTDSYRFTIPLKPRAKPRPRLTKRGYAYTPKSYAEYEKQIATYYKGPKFDGPVSVSITLRSKRMTVYITPLDEPDSTIRGDADNICKGILDALNTIAYDDDKQVQKLSVRKK